MVFPRGLCWAQSCLMHPSMTGMMGQSVPSAGWLVTPSWEGRLMHQRLCWHPASPGQAGELGPAQGIQQEPVPGPAPGGGQPPAPARAGGDLLGSGSAGKALGVLGGSEVTLSQHQALGAKKANGVLVFMPAD